jgi:GNAT superfamily N-acetyltransferase
VATGTVYRPFSVPDARRHGVAALLQHTYQWTRAASAVVPPVAQQVAPALTVAAQLYEAQQYTAALSQLEGVVTVLHQARQAYPALPEL